jgi:S1-C subfamily serine protease
MDYRKPFLAFLFFSTILSAQDMSVNKGELEFDSAEWGHLREVRGSYVPDMWTFRVDDRTQFLRIAIEAADMDIDLYLQHGLPLDDYSNADQSATTEYYKEKLELSRFWEEEFYLKSGTYYLYVVGYGKTESSSTYRLSLTGRDKYDFKELSLGGSQEAKLEYDTGMMETFRFEIEEDVPAFRIDLGGARMDLDLYLNKNQPAMGYNDLDYVSESELANEVLVVKRGTRSLKGTYYLTIWGQHNYEHPETVKVFLTPGEEAPEDLGVYPEFFNHTLEGAGSWERSLKATVELTSQGGVGSGAVLTPGGLILTNFHVIEAWDGEPAQEVYVGLNLDLGEPPRVLFKGEVLFFDKERDLAMVQIRSGALGQPLPADFRLHYFDPGESAKVSLGDQINVAGFPVTGGSGSRTSLSFTQGIIVGYEETFFGRILKTDAQINSGNSGGPAFDQSGRLIAIPTAIRGYESGQLAFLHPLTILPPSWVAFWNQERERHGLKAVPIELTQGRLNGEVP